MDWQVTVLEGKRALLLHLSGEEIQDIFETLDCGNSYADAIDALTEYFNPILVAKCSV
jgi:hypothetical protein